MIYLLFTVATDVIGLSYWALKGIATGTYNYMYPSETIPKPISAEELKELKKEMKRLRELVEAEAK